MENEMVIDRLYCILVKRELEDDYIFHSRFSHIPSRAEILDAVREEGLEYDDNYGKLEYWSVQDSEKYQHE